MEHSIIIAELKRQKDAIENAMAILTGKTKQSRQGRRKNRRKPMSKAARMAISKAMKARWASKKG